MKELREMSTTALSGYEGGPYYLSNLGIGTQRDGTMTFDPKKQEKTSFKKPSQILLELFLVIIFQQVIPTLLVVPSISDSPSQGLMHFPPMVLHIPLEEYQQPKVAISIQSHREILKGLKLRLLMEAGITSGTVYYGKSFIDRLAEKLDNYLQFNSIIDVRMDNLEDNLKTVADKRLSLESRIARPNRKICKTILSYGINCSSISRNW